MCVVVVGSSAFDFALIDVESMNFLYALMMEEKG